MEIKKSITIAIVQLIGLVILSSTSSHELIIGENELYWFIAYLTVVNMIGFFIIKLIDSLAEMITNATHRNR